MSSIIAIIKIETEIIAKNVTSVVNELELMWNRVGIIMIASDVRRAEAVIVIHFSSVAGMQSEAKFKNPV